MLQGNDLFKRSQQLAKFVIRLPARKNCRRKSVLNGGNGADDPHHLLGAETNDRDAKLIGEIAKSVKEALLFSGSAGFREIHFIESEDADLDFRQRVQYEYKLFLRWSGGTEFAAQLQQYCAVQPRFVGNARALQIEHGCRDLPAAVVAG